MKLLIVEDDMRIAATLKKGFETERFTIDSAYSGPEGYDFATTEKYDAIILDYLLPGYDGQELCRKLRKGDISTPIIMLTAKNQTSDIISSLDAGADDYLTKPFSFEELLARIRALTRRPHALSRDIIQVSDLTIDRTHYVVMRGTKTILLSQREYALLEYLARHMNQVVAKERLIQDVWEFDADILPNTVEAYIRKLREKIDIPFPSSSPLIHTVRGFGYKLAPST